MNTTEQNPQAIDLSDRCVLITGAGGALGSELALACGKAGASVVLLGRTISKLEACYDALEAAGAPQPAIYPLDLAGATLADHQTLINTLYSTFGGVFSIVHCAAELGKLTPLSDYPDEVWSKVFNSNLHGPMRLTQAGLPLLKDSGPSSVIYMLDDHVGAYWGAYGLSKATLRHAVTMLAEECDGQRDDNQQQLVNVIGINPGPMCTSLRQSAFPGEIPHNNPMPAERAAQILQIIATPGERNGQIIQLAEKQP